MKIQNRPELIQQINRKHPLQWITEKVEIDRGNFGIIYQAKFKDPDNEEEKTVVLKKLIINSDSEFGFSIPNFRELLCFKRLEHPNVIKYYDIFTTKKSDSKKSGSFYIMMESWRHSLIRYVDSKFRFTLSQIRYLAKGILSGINYLHSENICHRDIKLENILINENREIKITDFGLAKNIREDTLNMSQKVGTLCYKSPELMFDSSDYSYPVDIWACGVALFELISHTLPFWRKTEGEMLRDIWITFGCEGLEKFKEFEEFKKQFLKQQKKGMKDNNNTGESKIKSFIKLKSVTELDSDFIDLLSKMLEVDPEKRISAEDALKHEFFTKSSSSESNLNDLHFIELNYKSEKLALPVIEECKSLIDFSPVITIDDTDDDRFGKTPQKKRDEKYSKKMNDIDNRHQDNKRDKTFACESPLATKKRNRDKNKKHYRRREHRDRCRDRKENKHKRHRY